MKTRTEKQETINGLKADLDRAGSVILADYTNLTVAQADDLRGKFHTEKLTYRVVKNKLFVKATEGTAMAGLSALCKGPTAIGIGFEDPAAPARVMTAFAKGAPNAFKIKGGFASGKVLNSAGVTALSTMPTMTEMRAILLGVIKGPAQKLASLLATPSKQVVGVLQAKVDKK